jgi:phosphohistidine phosphatase
MKLYVIRHATAEAAGEAADLHRRLTPSGRRQAEEAGRSLRERGVSRLWLLSSPAARARETAELIAGQFEPAPEVQLLEALYTGPTLESLRSAVGDHPEVALVGHQPFVEHLVRGLLSHPADLRFPPSIVCCLEFESGMVAEGGRLAWVRNP